MQHRQASRPDVLDSHLKRPGNGDDPSLGQQVEQCTLGDDCPYKGAMRFLHDQRLERVQVEEELAVAIDSVVNKLKLVSDTLDELKSRFDELQTKLNLKVVELDAVLKAHTRNHRWIELLVMGLAMGSGAAFTRWLGGK